MSWLLSPEAGVSSINLIGDVLITSAVKGDIIAFDGTNWVDVTVGANDQVLTADSAVAAGVKWAAGFDPDLDQTITADWNFVDEIHVGTATGPGIRLSVDGSGIPSIFNTDASKVNEHLWMTFDQGGGPNLHHSGTRRLGTKADGVLAIFSDGNTDAETRRIELLHADGTIRAEIGYDINLPTALLFENQIDGGLVKINARNAAGATKNLFTGNPDGASTMFHAGVATVATTASGMSVTGDLTGTTIGGIVTANLLDKTAAELITANWIIDVGSSGPHLHVKGGFAGTDLAIFERDIGLGGKITMHSSNGDPSVRFTSGINLWNIGIDSTFDTLVITDIGTVSTSYIASLSGTGVDFKVAVTATSFGGITEANLLNKTANETISANWTHAGKVSISPSFSGEMLLLKDTTGAGTLASAFIGFDDSNGVRQGLVGIASSGNADMFLFSDIGDIEITAGSGQINLNDNTTITGTLKITGNAGFYNQAPVAKPTGVAVTAAGIHAALVTLNLIAA